MDGQVTDGASLATVITKIGVVLIIGILILGNIDTSLDTGARESVVISISDVPADGDTITLDSVVYEFDSGDGVTAGHVLVLAGASTATATTNLRAAITANSNYEVV